MASSKEFGDFFVSANRVSKVRNDRKFNKPTLTEQQHKEACDINNIVKQYTMQGYRTQDFQDLANRVFADASRFVDCTAMKDLQTASNLMMEAQDAFIQNVPAKIREQYNHDPMAFYKACVETNGDASKIKALFGDVRNFSAPNVEQLEEGNHLPVSSSKDNSQDE